MRVAILGPLEVRDGQGVPRLVTGLKRRALLATLVLRAGRTVSVDRLIGELWGEHPPANAANALQAHVRRLRTMLSTVGGGPDRILTRPPGYVLHRRVLRGEAFEVVGARREREAGQVAQLLREARAEVRMRVDAGANRRAALRERHSRGCTLASRSMPFSICWRQPDSSCPSVTGMASIRCVRPVFTMSPLPFLARSTSRSCSAPASATLHARTPRSREWRSG